MSRRRQKYTRVKKCKYKRFYTFTKQDEFCISEEKTLQRIHSAIAKEFYPDIKFKRDWQLQIQGLNIYFDSKLGAQAEILGTSTLPIANRLIMHIRLLELLRKGYSAMKAVRLCVLILLRQSKNLTNLNN